MLSRLLTISLIVTSLAFGYAKTPRPMADTKINLLKGGAVRTSSYRGKVVLLAIMSTQCESCAQAAAFFNTLQTEYGPKGVQIIGAVVNQAASKEVEDWTKNIKPIYPLGWMDEKTTRLAADLGATERPFVPILIFIDRQGMVQIQQAGDSPFFERFGVATRAALNNLLTRK